MQNSCLSNINEVELRVIGVFWHQVRALRFVDIYDPNELISILDQFSMLRNLTIRQHLCSLVIGSQARTESEKQRLTKLYCHNYKEENSEKLYSVLLEGYSLVEDMTPEDKHRLVEEYRMGENSIVDGRFLSKEFVSDLRESSGLLKPVLERVKLDDTLFLAIRSNYINIYYRGGNLLKISRNSNGSYVASFDTAYAKGHESLPVSFPVKIESVEDTSSLVSKFAQLKQIMDFYFSSYPKAEREIQQLIVRQNNSSKVSNESEYFVSDIEYSDSFGTGKATFRFDVVALKWAANMRQSATSCTVSLMELKFGDSALTGSAGIEKHLNDILNFVEDRERYSAFTDSLQRQFNQKIDLGLIRFNKSEKIDSIKLKDIKPELVFVFANHNPRSTLLHSELERLKPKIEAMPIDVKFFQSSLCGYAMHQKNMLTLERVLNILE